MGQQELLLTLGAIVAFSIASLAINQNTVRNTEAVYQRQAEFYALSMAQRFIEEAKTREFDEKAINAPVGNPTQFINPLKKDGTEAYPDFDDVDDFVDVPTTFTSDLGTMTVAIAVSYVTDTNLDDAAGTRTFYKKMQVTVTTPYLTNPVVVRYVFAFQKNF